MIVSRDIPSVYSSIQQEIDMAGLITRSEDIIDVMVGYCDRGYGKSTKEEMGKSDWYKY